MSCIQENGIYSLTNVKGGTCMDLSGGDNRSIIGYGYHGGPNQKWIFHRADGDQTFYIMSEGSRLFLAPEGQPTDGCKLIATGSPYAWRAEDEQGVDSGVRLLATSDTNYCADLSDHGNPTPGTPVELWGRWGGQNQVWKLQRV